MQMIQLVRKHIFTVFLLVYFILTATHLIEMSFTVSVIVGGLFGVGLAIYAHARRNMIAIALLGLHMAVEWFEWFSTGSSFVWMNLVHLAMDLFFLNHELVVHISKYRNVVIGIMAVIFMGMMFFGSMIPVHPEALELLHPFVIGGVLGCIASHAYFHITKEHAH